MYIVCVSYVYIYICITVFMYKCMSMYVYTYYIDICTHGINAICI